ncbi:MAG: hypothetical protein JWM80_5491 [Cyanobacteria bacterium RYN_339]|nr:hypothetical protein [Cyanobacteria bacterium RYN_339]
MKFRSALIPLTCALLLAGCGRGLPGTATAAASKGLRAHATGWQDTVVLDDFNRRHAYGVYAPDHHPFFKPLVFTFVGLRGGANTALELLAPDQETQPRKGFVLREDLGEAGLFLPPNADENSKPAPHVRLGFRWAVNGAVTQDPAIFAMTVFQLEKKAADGTEGSIGLAYAWTNEKYCPGQILKTVIGEGEDAIPTRVLVVHSGTGFGPKPCGASILEEMMSTSTVEQRSLEADLAYIHGRLPFDAGGNDAASTASGQADRTSCPQPAGAMAVGDPPINTEIYGVEKLGGGADMPQAICAHALLDDFTMQLKFEK